MDFDYINHELEIILFDEKDYVIISSGNTKNYDLPVYVNPTESEEYK